MRSRIASRSLESGHAWDARRVDVTARRPSGWMARKPTAGWLALRRDTRPCSTGSSPRIDDGEPLQLIIASS
jgi:hypothetical protein